MNAQVSFLDGTLSLIHIPLDLYPNLLQPILKILLPPSRNPSQWAAEDLAVDSHSHGFLNISVTPIECSIVCNSAWATSVFEPAIERLPKDQAGMVAISKDTYAALSVYGAGMDAGSRVADLTSPLALANIPIFFITTYYSDFILVPTKDRQAVVKTLLAQGFVFSDDDDSQLVSAHPSPTTTSHRHGHGFSFSTHSRGPSQDTPQPPPPSSSSSSPSSSPPSAETPTPTDSITNLQHRTFTLLKTHHITPYTLPNLTLAQCTGTHHHHHHHHPFPSSSSSSNSSHPPHWTTALHISPALYTSLIAALVAQPRFLSVTLAGEDPPSLLLDRQLLGLFGGALVGGGGGGPSGEDEDDDDDDDDALVPVFLDLGGLPVEATGIVSGVAGRLVREMGGMGGMGGVGELSFLSTARAGAVVLGRGQAGVALRVLGRLLEGEEGKGE